LAGTPSPEAQARLTRLVAHFDGEARRTARAVEALEQIGTDAAVAVVRTLVAEATNPAVTRNPRAALGRMTRTPAAGP